MTASEQHAEYAAAHTPTIGKKLRAAIDQRFVPLDTPLNGAKEVALFPPVSGG